MASRDEAPAGGRDEARGGGDDGPAGERDEARGRRDAGPAGAEVEIKVRDDGPYKVTGRVRLIDPEGRVIEYEGDRPMVLCRCGRSSSKPFCDGSHRRTGFWSRVRGGGA